jgi:hypothetical protein
MLKFGTRYKDGIIADVGEYEYVKENSVPSHNTKIKHRQTRKEYTMKENCSKERELYIIKNGIKNYLVW